MESRYSNVSIQVYIYTHSVRLLTLKTEVHVQIQKQENVIMTVSDSKHLEQKNVSEALTVSHSLSFCWAPSKSKLT